MASVLSSNPPLQIFAERRIAAKNLVGHGRTSGVQPDYTLWTEMDRCRLAIECKHYKRSSTRNFADALNDYSVALADAKVILVNYGPVSPSVQKAISATRSDRCEALGTFHPEGPKSLATFETLVNQVVGAPMPMLFREDKSLGRLGGHPVLLVDVSGSMKSILAQARTRSFVETLVRTNDIKIIVAADERRLVEAGVSANDIASVIAATGTGSTSLSQPVRELLERFTSVVVMTDSDGARIINEFPHVQTKTLWLGDEEIFLVSVTH
jgi:hypothetical protein